MMEKQIMYRQAINAFLVLVAHEGCAHGSRIRDLLIEHYPGNGAASDSGQTLLRDLHEGDVLVPSHFAPTFSQQTFFGLQYGSPAKVRAAGARKLDEHGVPVGPIPGGFHEAYVWAPGRAFPWAEVRAVIDARRVDETREWCPSGGHRSYWSPTIADEDGTGFCGNCGARAQWIAPKTLARHEVPSGCST